MKLETVLADLISEVVAEQSVGSSRNPMPDDMQRFIGALMKKARDRDAPASITATGKTP